MDRILSRLAGVKKTCKGRWLACCPAHDDKRPSLAIRELSDGRILIHCFAQCTALDVLAAAGLEFKDLYPEAIGTHLPKARRPFAATDVLSAMAQESLIVAISASDLSKGAVLSDDDRARLWRAATRLQNAYEVACG